MRGVAKGAVYALGGVALLLVLGMTTVYGVSERRFSRSYEVAVAPLDVTAAGTNGAAVTRGAHLARIRGCLDCHGEDGGGAQFADDPAFGVLWASNLTAGEGGVAGSYTDEDWDRAVRHGIGPGGRPLYFMPSQEFWALSDDDLAALIAHFRAIPPVDRTRPESKPGPLARVLFLAGKLPLIPAELVDHAAVRPPAPAAGPTASYGGYLATGCTGCHGVGFSGGKIVGGDPSWPPAANITPDVETGIGAWSESDFVRAMREGRRPDGRMLDPAMPLSMTKHLTDDELRALYSYLRTLPPAPHGNR